MLSLSQNDFECCVVHSLQIGLDLFLLQGTPKPLSFYFDFTFDILSLISFLGLV